MIGQALTGRWNRKITALGGNFQPFSVHPYFDASISGIAGYGLRNISQGVLIPCFRGDFRIRVLDGVAGEFGKWVRTTGGINEFREVVSASLVGQMELLELPEPRQRAAVDHHGSDLDVSSLQQMQHAGSWRGCLSRAHR